MENKPSKKVDGPDCIVEFLAAVALIHIIHGKLDQKNSQLEVEYAIGRDVRQNDLDEIIQTLGDWCSSCERVLTAVEIQIEKAEVARNDAFKHKANIESEVANVKKALRTQAIVDSEGSLENVPPGGKMIQNIGQADKSNKKLNRLSLKHKASNSSKFSQK